MSVKIIIKADIDQSELELEHKPETCTESDIDAMCYGIRRYLREVYGRAPNGAPSKPASEHDGR